MSHTSKQKKLVFHNHLCKYKPYAKQVEAELEDRSPPNAYIWESKYKSSIQQQQMSSSPLDIHLENALNAN